jgi:hypothetical protein
MDTDTEVDRVNWYIDHNLVHEIHTSERRSFRGCRRRWDWLFRRNLYPLTTAKPLEFGVAFHEAMETYYDPEKAEFPPEIRAALAIEAFRQKCEAQRKKAEEYWNGDLDLSIQADYNERVELGIGMLKYYTKKIAPTWDYGWTTEKVEVSFMLPIPHPDTGEYIFCKCNLCWKKWFSHLEKEAAKKSAELAAQRKPGEFGAITMQPIGPLFQPADWKGLPVTYAGRLDVLARDANGDLWVVDWKTAANIPDDHYWLDLDDQVGSYPWALNRLGIPVRGFVYVEIKKAFPEPPKENALRRKGCKFSVSRIQNVDYETYFAHVMEHDTEAVVAGYYEEFLDWLKNNPPKYFDRHIIYHSPDKMKAIEHNIGLEALDMINPDLRIYPSPGRFACGGCAFRQPCLEKDAGGDHEYYLTTMYEERVPYYVREPSTESKGGE